jgi:3-deoxy-D-manno-octulosonic-acid transferase
MAWSARFAPAYAERRLATRLAAGKEDAARLDERRGIAGLPRPRGPLMWFHAASVGESMAILELLRRLGDERPDLSLLVTTGTVTSAKVMADRLPPNAVHQLVPLDARPFVRCFLDHWKPDVAVWTESDFWPALMVETHARGIPMLLVNARMSKASHDKWRWLKGMVRSLLRRFDHTLVQDDLTAGYLRRLGMPAWRMTVTGTLKEGAGVLPASEQERSDLARHLSGRPVWLAASTHEGEERKLLEAHRAALKVNPRLLLIIVPRHPERGDALAEMLQADGWTFNRRTADELPESDAQVYLADTMGELGLWYRLSPISFVGGSLEPIGGHNPFEPAALGSAILHGPYVTNFVDIYQRLSQAGAARLVSSPESLSVAVHELLNPERAATMANAAWDVCSAGADVTDRAMALLLEKADAMGTS